MGVSYADHYQYPYPADIAVPGPAAPWFPASGGTGTGTGTGTHQPYSDGPGASRVSPVTPDLLRSLLRSLSQLR